MNKEELFKAFCWLFPEWGDRVKGYKKIGSKTLAIEFYDHVTPTGAVSEQTSSRVFLYNNPDNWQFGTKLWRKRPERIEKKKVSFDAVEKKTIATGR